MPQLPSERIPRGYLQSELVWEGVSFRPVGCPETCLRPVGASRLRPAASRLQRVPGKPAGAQPGCRQQAGLLPSPVSLHLALCGVNFSSLLGRVSPPCVPTSRFWEDCGRHVLLVGFLSAGKRACTFCMLREALLPTSKGSPFFLLCLPPPNIPYCSGKPFVPRLLAQLSQARRCGWRGGDSLPSLQSQHKALQGFQPARRWGGESCCCHGNHACMEQRCPSGPGELQTHTGRFVPRLEPAATLQGLAFPALFLKTPLHAVRVFVPLSCLLRRWLGAKKRLRVAAWC